jgi:hypothetical protein
MTTLRGPIVVLNGDGVIRASGLFFGMPRGLNVFGDRARLNFPAALEAGR